MRALGEDDRGTGGERFERAGVLPREGRVRRFLLSSYHWRRRLRTVDEPVRFALVETKPAQDWGAPLELIFTSGERLRISPGVDAATLQLVMAAVRA